MRYENDEEDCVVQDPIDETNTDEEKEYKMKSNHIIPSLGTPVICHCLQENAYLNGKIGVVRYIGDKRKRTSTLILTKIFTYLLFIFKTKARSLRM